MDERLKHFGIGAAVGLAFAYVYASTTPSNAPSTTEEKKVIPKKLEKSAVEKVVLEFLESQSERNLDKMCSLVDDEIVYINEPHPIERAIRGKKMFREVFQESPCMWCTEANLQLLQSCYNGDDTVFVERHDQFLVDGKWIKIPILGYLKVKNGKIVLWKDYWDYKKYKDFVNANFGPDFHLFRKTLQTKA